MIETNWRDNLEPSINKSLDNLIKETKQYDYAISQAKDRSKAQLWVALAIVNAKLSNNDTSVNIKEDNDFLKYKKRIPKKEMEEILNTLESF